jgi:hypothetical protein
LSCELAKWDERESGALVVTFFEDERPLRGAAGLADWRLCGRLSRLIKKNRVEGSKGESLMMPPGRRLPFERILLFGLGSSTTFNEDIYRQMVRRIHDVVARAKITDYAVQPPGRASGLIAARRALELWIEEGTTERADDDVFIIDSSSAQKEMADILHAHQRIATKRDKAKPKPRPPAH